MRERPTEADRLEVMRRVPSDVRVGWENGRIKISDRMGGLERITFQDEIEERLQRFLAAHDIRSERLDRLADHVDEVI